VQSLNLNNAKNQITGQDSLNFGTFYLKEWSYSIPVARDPQIQTGVSTWAPPPTGFLKLNFDGATKGNPGVAGAGGVIRDSGGTIIRLYAGSIGNSTNNAVEFGALELGLEILRREGMTNTIVEGDSTLVINTVKKLQYGTKVGKVQRHWRLAQSLQKIKEHLRTLNMVEFRWIRRTTNALADRLANEGVNREGQELDEAWTRIPRGKLRMDCIHLAARDHGGSFRDEGHIEEDDARLLELTWDPGRI
jgi:ribonuclease HI